MKRVCILWFVVLASFSLLTACTKNIPFGERKDVQQFIHDVSKEHNFETKELTQLFNQVQFKPKVISKVQHPFEKTQPWYEYREHFLNQERINKGVLFWKKYQKVLGRAEKIYQVPANMIVAIIGIESNYGEKTGDFSVLDALSNIVFNYSERRDFFQMELVEFLLLCREHHLNPLTVYGSYAGAIGQPQFMPSSFRKYAVDFSHTGSVDLMHNDIDVIGSVANYFNAYGWKYGKPVAIRTKINFKKAKLYAKKIQEFLITESKTDPTLSLAELEKLGVYPVVPLDKKQKVGLIQLETKTGYEYWIGLNNFFVIKHYNRSPMYAMAAYELSQKIKDQYDKANRSSARISQ
ncbi:MAG: lytic murein transglycosylase B [Gammaproteobacteria bacterium]|nr:lytic murein transglycosylase B [Gammaproteobacteria bacterium]